MLRVNLDQQNLNLIDKRDELYNSPPAWEKKIVHEKATIYNTIRGAGPSAGIHNHYVLVCPLGFVNDKSNNYLSR